MKTLFTLLLFVAPCAAPTSDGSCPDGYRHLYDKTDSGPCVAEWAK